jgi:hypothetical protein
MRKPLKIILIAAAVLIVGGGTTFGIVISLTWGEYAYSDTYFYDPGVPSSIEKIDFNCDIGAITINYNSTPTNEVVKVELSINIKGGFVQGKTFSDFFHPIIWLNESTPVVTFTLTKKINPAFIFGLFHNIQVDVTLRSDVIYDIDALSQTGSIILITPVGITLNNTHLITATGSIGVDSKDDVTFLGLTTFGTSTGSIDFYADNNNFTHGLTIGTSTGSATVNLTNCIMGDDLTIGVSTGSIDFSSYNMQYAQNVVWDIETSTGSVDIAIYQSIGMGANVTGSIQTSTGGVDVIYKDTLSTVGAEFDCGTGTGTVTYLSSGTGGFSWIGDSNNKVITSDDHSASTSRYTLTVSASTGSIEVIGESL